MFGRFGKDLLDGLAVVFDKRLLQKAVLGVEFLYFAFDNFIYDIRRLILNLLGENGLFPLDDLWINLVFIKCQGFSLVHLPTPLLHRRSQSGPLCRLFH